MDRKNRSSQEQVAALAEQAVFRANREEKLEKEILRLYKLEVRPTDIARSVRCGVKRVYTLIEQHGFQRSTRAPSSEKAQRAQRRRARGAPAQAGSGR